MELDWKISIGNILTAAGLLIGFLLAHNQNIRRLARIEERLNLMYRWWQNHWLGIRQDAKDVDEEDNR